MENFNKSELLERWMELKSIENDAKEERVALEEQIFVEYANKTGTKEKLSETINEGDIKLTIKLNRKLKVTDESLIPEDADVYKQVVDEKKLENYKDEDWVEECWNKPTFTVVRKV